MEYGGPVCFLFTDIAGSTPMWQHHPAEMAQAIALHNEILHTAIRDAGGRVFKTIGDAFCGAFTQVEPCLQAAKLIQDQLAATSWPPNAHIQVRMAIHWGVPFVDGDDYQGHDVNLVARLLGQASPGQVLVSETAARAQSKTALISLGAVTLKGIAEPVTVLQLGGASNDFPPLTGLGETPTNLRVPLTRLVGRDREIGELQHLIAKHRLVTLLGPGGVGKTHLVTDLGLGVRSDYADGVWFVDLTDLPPGADSLPAAFSVLAPRSADPLNEIKSKQMLIILDNCEHVLDSVRGLIRDLIQRTTVTVLVTSRELIGVPGERSFQVHPLGTSGDFSAAEELFVARCEEVCPGLNAADAKAISHKLVASFAGFPLAIVLAASLAASYPLSVLHDMVASGKELRAMPGMAPERHRSVEATISWSYHLLSEMDQKVLQRMTVFAGGADFQALTYVAQFGDVDEAGVAAALARLTRASLVQLDPTSGRYSSYQPIKEYAQAILRQSDDWDSTVHRHVTWVYHLSEEARPQLDGTDADRWMRRLELEHSNVRQALVHSTDLELKARIVANLHYFWIRAAHLQEALAWSRGCMSRLNSDDRELMSSALSALGVLEWCAGDLESATRTLFRALEFADTPRSEAKIKTNLALVCYNHKDFELALSLLREAELIYVAENEEFLTTLVRLNMCTMYHETDRLTEARDGLTQVIESADRLNAPSISANALRVMCECKLKMGDPPHEIIPLALRSFEACLRLEDRFGLAACAGLILMCMPNAPLELVGYWLAAKADVATSNPWLVDQMMKIQETYSPETLDSEAMKQGMNAWSGGDITSLNGVVRLIQGSYEKTI